MIIMNRTQKIIAAFVLLITVISIGFVISLNFNAQPQDGIDTNFPDFITKNEDYFITRIDGVPTIDREEYHLDITGFVENPRSFTLDELQSLNLTELTLTYECIGNGINGNLIGTAVWKGFIVYDLLDSLGIMDNATGIKIQAADGYYVSYTMDQLKNNTVLGALYMNGEEIPPIQGFPLRILNPGYYGAKQPAWVVGIEVIDTPLEDYWDDRGWDTSPPMPIDSQIFFPRGSATTNTSESLTVGGCAFGGTRVKYVEYTLDGGVTWNNATIVQQIDADNVWVFWQIELSFTEKGQFTLKIRATDINGNHQVQLDTTVFDGISSWPSLVITVV